MQANNINMGVLSEKGWVETAQFYVAQGRYPWLDLANKKINCRGL
jgi:hypothetical protein